ncbi:hypothetical protein BKA83DRAFT_1840838 [Pisolithus microcarpus]|nr:hypothetical protein BKA83DRAFT_1840838 [Pisolithus microcarpus]
METDVQMLFRTCTLTTHLGTLQWVIVDKMAAVFSTPFSVALSYEIMCFLPLVLRDLLNIHRRVFFVALGSATSTSTINALSDPCILAHLSDAYM